MTQPLTLTRPSTGPRMLERWLPRLLLGLALAAFVGYFLIYAYYARALFRFPFDYDQGEGYELQDTLLFSQGEWPYRDNTVFPFYASNYPPLFHLMVVPLLPLAQLSGNPLLPGRFLSFSATLITATAIGWAVQRYTRRPAVAVLSGLAFLASNYVYHIGPLFRLHMTMVMFEALGIVALDVAIDWEKNREKTRDGRPERKRLALGLGLLLAAGYTKQMAVATVGAGFLFLLLRKPRVALLSAIPFGLVAAGLFWWINQATAGQWMFNIITANINDYDFGQALGLYQQWFHLHAVLILLAILGTAYELIVNRLSIYVIWFALAVASAALAGKWGAGESYFTTAVAASCILGGITAGRVWNALEQRGRRSALAAGLLIPALFLVQASLVAHLPTESPTLQPIQQALGWPAGTPIGLQSTCTGASPPRLLLYYDAGGYTQLGRPPTAADIQAGWEITRLVADSPGPSLSEDAGFALNAGKGLTANPTQLYNLSKKGLLDSSSMIQMIRQHRYGTVVLRAQLYPQEVNDAIGQAYRQVAHIEMNGFVYCVLKPRD